MLGVLQGLTEFVPISSSAHLVLVPWLLGWPSPALAFDTTLHLGTLAAILAYFWRDIGRLAAGFWASLRERRLAGQPERRLAWLILAGSLPAALAGYLLEDFFARLFQAPLWVAGLLVVTGLALILGERAIQSRQQAAEMGFLDALLIGLAQACAIAPGISRSGATISMGLWRGLGRRAAARYSFLLAVPVLLGSGLWELIRLVGRPSSFSWQDMTIGFLAAAGSGYLCIRYLLSYLRRGRLHPFAIYCCLVGVLTLGSSFLAGCRSATPTPVPISGCPAMRPLLEELAQAYLASHSSAAIEFREGNGPQAERALKAGQIDILMACREPSPGEELQVALIAQDGIAILVNSANAVQGLNLSQLRDILDGQVLDWEEVGGRPGEVMVLSREEGPLRSEFERLVMEGATVTPAAIVLPSGPAMAQWVADHPAAIGYGSLAHIITGTRALEVEGLAPTAEGIGQDGYPLFRPFLLWLAPEPRPEAVAFASFILGPQGQEVVGRRYGRVR